MTDHFAVLGEPRRPWLDPDILKDRFLELSSPHHPDRVHGTPEAERRAAEARYAEFNAAHLALRDVRTRLLHLLELELGERPRDIQRIPPGTMELFMQVGQGCREVDAFLEKRNQVTSPMLKVRLFQEGLDWADRLMALQGTVNERERALTEELRGMNAAFEAAPPSGDARRATALPLGRLEEIYRVLSYVSRWTAQIQERLVQLQGL